MGMGSNVDKNVKNIMRKYDVPTKGSFTIIDIYESVHSVRFLITPSPKAYSKQYTPLIGRFKFNCA